MIEMPFEIEFILTLNHRCNFKCNMCIQADNSEMLREIKNAMVAYSESDNDYRRGLGHELFYELISNS